ncbi:MAG: exodeoxyribonuclease III [Lentimicrobiaceae bacterium]|jgi:exodeoxyribonuclease-3|nr:exodeoxyribonuclease III [Lentimicrobiaceae bacterium]
MRIVSYNVNGIRSAIGKGLLDWLKSYNADVVCFQELKATVDQIPLMEFQLLGYNHYWYPAKKKGYSGVAILSKKEPDDVVYGVDCALYDDEGRFVRADFGDLSVVSVYHPSGTSGDERQAFKMKWLDFFQDYVEKLRKERPKLVLSGDYNICHEAIDIHDPIRNATHSGFLPEEREWMSGFLKQGYIDSFRHLIKEPDHYSWWSYRANARENNKGWRIDYHMLTENLLPYLKAATILPNVKHSDHCPVVVELKY